MKNDYRHIPFCVCVFAGTNSGVNPQFLHEAKDLGQRLANQGWSMIFGGGKSGMMGAVANAAWRGGAKVTGVIPRSMAKREDTLRSHGVEIVSCGNMHQRKEWMYTMADAFIVLPGGIGTLDELVEVLTWKHLNLHQKPIILVNIDRYWDFMFHLLNHLSTSGFLSSSLQKTIECASSAQVACLCLEKHLTLLCHSTLAHQQKDSIVSIDPLNLIDQENIPGLHLSSLNFAKVIQAYAADYGFDWEKLSDALNKIKEELLELENELSNPIDHKKINMEFGDLLLAIINLGRKLDIDPNDALEKAASKFIQRFYATKKKMNIAVSNDDHAKNPLACWLACWEAVKKNEHCE